MCVPDMALIVEIMLMSEGFNMSKMLSRKFVILYRLCEDLLSKSKHYDWKLRAIKTTLYVAGGMKRSAPDLSEDKVNPCFTSDILCIHTVHQCIAGHMPYSDCRVSPPGDMARLACHRHARSRPHEVSVYTMQQKRVRQCVCNVA